MKITLIVLGIAAFLGVCGVLGCRLLANRPPEATIPLTARPQGKVAIVYFSQSKVGNTATVARWIQKHAGGDLIALDPVKPYPEPYSATLKAVERDFNEGRLPALKTVPDLAGYDVIFLGSPIWYGSYAPVLETFLKTNPLAGKTVAPFCTHGGHGEGRFATDLRRACPQARLLDVLVLRGSNQIERRLGRGISLRHTEDDVVKWLNRVFAERKTD